MEKQEMIIEIINLYDEITQLNTTIDKLRSSAFKPQPKEESSINYIDKIMIEEGKKTILKECIYDWGCCNVTYNEDADIYTVDSYEKWLEKKLRNNYIPKNISYNDFKGYFEKELWAMYENEKIKAVNAAKKEKE